MEPTGEPRLDWLVQLIDIMFLAIGLVTNLVTDRFQPFFESIIAQLMQVFQPVTG